MAVELSHVALIVGAILGEVGIDCGLEFVLGGEAFSSFLGGDDYDDEWRQKEDTDEVEEDGGGGGGGRKGRR